MNENQVPALEAEIARLRTCIEALERSSPREIPAFLTGILRALPAIVIRFDADLKIRLVSRVVPGLREADIVGADALDFIPREDHATARAVIEKSLRSGEPGHYETTGPGPNGERRRYRVFVAPVPDADGRIGGCFVAFDVSDLIEQERTLAATERKLRIALEATKLGLWTWDLVTGELIWDEGMRQLVGRSKSLTLPEYIEKAVHADDRDMVREAGERAMATGVVVGVTHRIVRPDGEVRWMLNVGEIERDDSGRAVRIMGGLLDITHQQQLEDQVRRAQKAEAIGRLTAGVAHNFNNMLMILLPSLELIRAAVPTSHAGMLADASGAAERAADMVRNLMRFAGQRLRGNAEPRDAAETARRLVGMCERTFDRHVELRCSTDAAEPWVRLEAGDLEQILMNLLLNARDAVLDPPREHPRIEVSVADASPDPRLPAAGRLVRLRVTDNGAGMSAATLQHVFEPFHTTKGVGRGTGLGLATSEAIVRDAGGRIDIDSAPGEGTTVSVLLPVFAAPAAKAPPPIPAPAAAGRRLLVVDDEPLIRALLERSLGEAGYRVRTAGSAAAALAAIAEQTPEAILLDRSMPDTPGPAVLSALRAAAPSARIAWFTGEDVTPEERSRVEAVILKPVQIEELERALAELLQLDPRA